MRVSLHIWKFEVLLWFRRRQPVPSIVVVSSAAEREAVSDILASW